MEWILDHWKLVGAGLLILGWIVTRLTPWIKDDIFYDKLLKFIFSLPFRMIGKK